MTKRNNLKEYLQQLRDELDFSYGLYSLQEAQKDLARKEKRFSQYKPSDLECPDKLKEMSGIKDTISELQSRVWYLEKEYNDRREYNRFLDSYLFCVINEIPIAKYWMKDERHKFHIEKLNHLYEFCEEYEAEGESLDDLRAKIVFHINELNDVDCN